MSVTKRNKRNLGSFSPGFLKTAITINNCCFLSRILVVMFFYARPICLELCKGISGKHDFASSCGEVVPSRKARKIRIFGSLSVTEDGSMTLSANEVV